MSACPLAHESVWIEKAKYNEAEKNYYEKLSKGGSNQSTLVSEIAKAREHIKNSLEKMDGIASLAGASAGSCELLERIVSLEKQNSDLTKLVEKLSKTVLESQSHIKSLEQKFSGLSVSGGKPATAAPAPAASAADDDDGVDLFASDEEEEDAEAAKIREERVAAYAAKKSKKPVLIAKSSVLLDVKPWDDETDMKEMEKKVRTIVMDGLLWGASKLVPVGYGINKLQIMCVIEDDKVSIDLLTEKIEEFEDFVQSVDIAAFNKI